MSTKQIPDSKRLNELMDLTAEPEDMGEYALVETYKAGLTGETLMKICLDMQTQIEHYTIYEYAMFILGYAIGQKDHSDSKDGIDLKKIKRNDDTSFH